MKAGESGTAKRFFICFVKMKAFSERLFLDD
jgi:hypothetical protein